MLSLRLPVVFILLSSVAVTHQPEKRFFEENLVRIYPAKGEVLYDKKNSICLNLYWVPDQDDQYIKKYLPTYCDGRLLTIGKPHLRLEPIMIGLPKPPFLHSSIRRDLSSGSLEFSKDMLRYFLLFAKKLQSGIVKEWEGRKDHRID